MKLLLTIGLLITLLLAIGGWFAPTPTPYYSPPPSRVPQLERQLATAQGDITRLQLQIADLTTELHAIQAKPTGLSGEEVRELVETLTPEPTTTTTVQP